LLLSKLGLVMSVRAEQPGCHLSDFLEISYLGRLIKFVDTFVYCLISDKCNNHILHEDPRTFNDMVYDMICLLTAIGLAPVSSTHLHTNNTQNSTVNVFGWKAFWDWNPEWSN